MNSSIQITISLFSIGDEGTDASKYNLPISDISFGNPCDPEYAILRISIPQVTETTEGIVKHGLLKLGVGEKSTQDIHLAVKFTIAINGKTVWFPNCISQVNTDNSEVKLTAYIYKEANDEKWWAEDDGKKLSANEYDLPFLANDRNTK